MIGVHYHGWGTFVCGEAQSSFLNADISETTVLIVLPFGVWSGTSAKLFTQVMNRGTLHTCTAHTAKPFSLFARSFGYYGVLQVMK